MDYKDENQNKNRYKSNPNERNSWDTQSFETIPDSLYKKTNSRDEMQEQNNRSQRNNLDHNQGYRNSQDSLRKYQQYRQSKKRQDANEYKKIDYDQQHLDSMEEIFDPEENGPEMDREIRRTPKRNNYAKNQNQGYRKSPLGKNSKNKKSQFNLFMGITIGAGFLVCIIVFFLIVSILGKGNPNKNNGSVSGLKTEDVVSSGMEKESVFLIQSIHSEGEIDVIEVLTNQSTKLKVTASTELKNKYGQSIILAEFIKGDIVTITFDEQTNTVLSLIQNSEAWDMPTVTNLIIDKNEQTVTVGNKSFQFNENLITNNKGNPFDIFALSDKDVVSLKGYKDQLCVVTMEKSFGTLVIQNHSHIKDGILEIGNTDYRTLNDTNEINVLEGTYQIVVKGSNIENYSQEVKISSGEKTVFNLSAVQTKNGILKLNVNQDNYDVYVDGKMMDNSKEPLALDYKTYKITVKKEGFSEWNRDITLNKPETVVDVKLTEIVKTGTLTILSTPDNAQVYIDNAFVGTAPVDKKVAYGSHTVTVKLEGYYDVSLPVTIDSETKSFRVTLTKATPPPDTSSEAIIVEPTVEPEPEY